MVYQLVARCVSRSYSTVLYLVYHHVKSIELETLVVFWYNGWEDHQCKVDQIDDALPLVVPALTCGRIPLSELVEVPLAATSYDVFLGAQGR